MESITALEKVKNPIISLIGGILLGGYVAWNSAAGIHEERVKLLEATKAELERQVASRNKAIEEKDIELKNVYSKLSTNPATAASSSTKPEFALQSLITQLDTEIEKKKVDLANHAGTSVTSFKKGGRQETPKSDSYIHIEQELQALSEQRDMARKKLIDGLSK